MGEIGSNAMHVNESGRTENILSRKPDTGMLAQESPFSMEETNGQAATVPEVGSRREWQAGSV